MEKNRTLLKSYFENYDKPNQEEFWDWLDSFFNYLDDVHNDISGRDAAACHPLESISVDPTEFNMFPVDNLKDVVDILNNGGSNPSTTITVQATLDSSSLCSNLTLSSSQANKISTSYWPTVALKLIP